MDNKKFNRVLRLVLGIVFLVLGTALILSWWDALVILTKGAIGIILALAGLFLLYSLKV